MRTDRPEQIFERFEGLYRGYPSHKSLGINIVPEGVDYRNGPSLRASVVRSHINPFLQRLAIKPCRGRIPASTISLKKLREPV